MSSSDSEATATENASRLGYKHVCVNYVHVTSHDCQEVIQHTHTHTHTHSTPLHSTPLHSTPLHSTHSLTHSLTHRIVLFFVSQLPPLFQHEFKWRMKVPNIIESKHKSQACHKQTKEGVKRYKGPKSQYC